MWLRSLTPLLFAAPVAIAAGAAFLYFGVDRASSSLQTGSVQIVGSETIRPILSACAEDFLARNPQADVIVKGGGSGDGIAAVLHGIADIGMTSRVLSNAERQFASSKGIELSVNELALDGVSIIVGQGNRIAALDFTQLRDIYSGRIRNWRELSGPDLEIMVYGRATGSGTAALFAERILDGGAYSPLVKQLATNEAIVAEVAARPGALGYTGFGALRTGGERIRPVAVRADVNAAAVAPAPESIRTGSYPLARALYLAVPGKPAGAVKAFLDFCGGAGGQVLIQRAGYVAAVAASP